MTRLASQISVLALLLLAGSIAASASVDTPSDSGTPVSPDPARMISVLTAAQDGFASIAKRAEPFVVNITATRPAPFGLGTDSDPGDTTPKAPSPTTPNSPSFPREEEATGSGLIVRPDGYILTNDHVVEGSQFVTVTLSDGRDYRGTVIPDYRSDLALVKIDAGSDPLPCAEFDLRDDVQSGQWAIAIGSPFDLQNTMTVGVISALHRHQTIGDDTETRFYPDLIQTDAAINPGNSGGPLLNINGEVVGVNVAIESPVDGSSGVGFAIPASTAIYVVDQLIKNGKVVRGYLGIDPEDMTPNRANETGVPAGAWVRQVLQDSPAGRAGVRAADVVTKFNGTPVTDGVGLRNAIAATAPGTQITLQLVRDSNTMTLFATVAQPPQSATDNVPAPTPARQVGLTYRALTASDLQQLGLSPNTLGVFVTAVAANSPADDAEFFENDIVEQIGHKHILAVNDASDALDAIQPGIVTTVVVLRKDHGSFQELALDLKL